MRTTTLHSLILFRPILVMRYRSYQTVLFYCSMTAVLQNWPATHGAYLDFCNSTPIACFHLTSRCTWYHLQPHDGFSLLDVPAGCNLASFPVSHEVQPCHQSLRWFRSALHHRCGQQTVLCPNCILLFSGLLFQSSIV